MSNSTNNIKAIALATLGFALFAVTDAIAKYFSAEYSVFEMIFWFSIFGTASLLIFSEKLGGFKETLRSQKMKWHALRSVLTILISMLAFYALAFVQLVNFYTIIFITPFITALLAIPFLKQKTDWRHWLIIGGGFIGVLVSLRPHDLNIGLPEIAIFITAILFALRNLIVPKMGENETILSYALWPQIAMILFTLIFIVPDFRIPDMQTLLLFCFAGVLGNSIAYPALSYAFLIAPSSTVAPVHYSQLIWGFVFGFFIFGDVPDFWAITGATIVTFFGLLLIWFERQSGKT